MKYVKKYSIILFAVLLFASLPVAAFASEAEAGTGHGDELAITFLFLAVLILAAKLGAIVEKIGQPAVLGEIGAGIVLSAVVFFGLHQLAEIRESSILAFLAELGAVILLFQIGLESNIGKMMKVGVNSLLVAIIGVVAPFLMGAFVLGPWLFPAEETAAHLFLGAALVATSVGITAYVFRELGISKLRASQTVLGAAVIDDILGLLVLAVVSALALQGSVDTVFIVQLSLKAFIFLAAALLFGRIFARPLSWAFSRISTGIGMKLTLALAFAFSYAYLATLVGLAPIVGAFAAGLVLDAVHFNSFSLPRIAYQLKRLRGFDEKERAKINRLIEEQRHGHIEDLIGNIGLLLIPIFFIYTGFQIEFSSLLQPSLYLQAAIISFVAILTKVIAGAAARGNFTEKLLVGVSMVPRGEVGLIFASVGKGLGAISDDLFSVIILTIIVTTFIAPPLLKIISARMPREAESASE